MSNPERQSDRDQNSTSQRFVNFRKFVKSPSMVLICLAVLLLLAGAASSGSKPSIGEADTQSSIDKTVSKRLIPDQKALLGATVTTIDLRPLLSMSELAKSG